MSNRKTELKQIKESIEQYGPVSQDQLEMLSKFDKHADLYKYIKHVTSKDSDTYKKYWEVNESKLNELIETEETTINDLVINEWYTKWTIKSVISNYNDWSLLYVAKDYSILTVKDFYTVDGKVLNKWNESFNELILNVKEGTAESTKHSNYEGDKVIHIFSQTNTRQKNKWIYRGHFKSYGKFYKGDNGEDLIKLKLLLLGNS